MTESGLAFDLPQDAFFLTALADHASDIILATEAEDIDGPNGPRIVYCNAAFERQSGWTRDDIMGRTPRILQTPETDRRELDKIRRALEAWRAGDETARARVLLRNRHRNGARYWSEIDLAPVWAPDRGRSFWISIQRDVTERMTRDAVVREALEREHAARSVQEEFVAKVSHDMRTPLSAITGYAELLSAETADILNETQRRALRAIGESGHQLSRLVKDLLDVAALTRGELRLDVEAIMAGEIVDYVVGATRPAARQRGLSIVTGGEKSAMMLCDGVRARQCITNLLDNAIKFSDPHADIRITVQTIEDRVAISVADDGPGMDAAQLKTALSLFGQVRAARRDGDGVGLGLPIVAQLMRMQGGELSVVTAPGEGATFTLVFAAEGAR